jgi:hypothetical protein
MTLPSGGPYGKLQLPLEWYGGVPVLFKPVIRNVS